MCLCFSEGHGKLTVFAMKAMLATMCGGKILDKLRCEYNAYNTVIQHLFYKDIIDIFCHKAEFIWCIRLNCCWLALNPWK